MCRKLVLIAFSIVLTGGSLIAQDLLKKKVSLTLEGSSLQQALAEISKQADCRFSYNPDLLPAKVPSGTYSDIALEEALKRIVGNNFAYKVRGSYVIIQPATEKHSGKSNIEFAGEVVDARTGKRLSNTSVYEVNNLSSTLSGDDGSYKLSTFFQGGITAFAISKENYRDTIIRVSGPQIEPIRVELQPIEMPEIVKDRNLFAWVDSLDVVEFLINTKTRLHMRNVDMAEQRWAQLSLVPVVGTNGLMGGKVSNNVSLNMFGGYAHSVKGVELGGFFNIDRMGVSGAQAAGFLNVVGGKVSGAQMAGFVNLTPGGVAGAQLAGFVNHAGTDFVGAQGAGFVNISNRTRGTQLSGFTNFTLFEMHGFQGSGFLNLAGSVRGAQATGFLNMAKSVSGVQISGLLNVAKTVSGFQIGIVNVAQKVEKGATIGILNLVKEGLHEFALEANDVTPVHIAFRSGTRKFYSVLSAGLRPVPDGLWTAGLGFGTEVSWTEKLYTNIELSNHVVQPIEAFLAAYTSDSRVNIHFGYTLKKWLSLNAGPVLHLYNASPIGEVAAFSSAFGNNPLFERTGPNSLSKMWIGYSTSIRF